MSTFDLPLKVDLHDDPGKVASILFNNVTFQLHGFLLDAVLDCQAGSHCVELVLDTLVQVVKGMMVIHHPGGKCALFLVVMH